MKELMQSNGGVVSMMTGIILASGFSRRMGKEKLLLKVNGIPMIERVIMAAQSSHLDELIIIYQRDEITDEGQSAAVKLGIQSSHPDTEGFMFLVGDQPYLDPSTINKLIALFKRDRTSIVVPLYNGAMGNPVIFPATAKKDLLLLKGDCGGRRLIEQMRDIVKLVEIEKSIVGMHIDTEEEYKNIQELKEGGKIEIGKAGLKQDRYDYA
jgi:molybdenum cofactor cytidylyltransferase